VNLDDLQLGTVPDWIAAIATSGALLVAVSLLARELRTHAVTQARLISAWVTELEEPGTQSYLSVIVQNKSDEPVYDLVIWTFDSVADEDVGEPGSVRFSVDVLPPDTRHQATESLPARMGHVPTITVKFTDSAGRRWRRSGGRLHEVENRGPEL
jgi:hypothetical protein